jgi:hypothetical protein
VNASNLGSRFRYHTRLAALDWSCRHSASRFRPLSSSRRPLAHAPPPARPVTASTSPRPRATGHRRRPPTEPSGFSLHQSLVDRQAAPRPRKQPFGSATDYALDSQIAAKPIGAIHVCVAGHSTRGIGIVAAWISRTGCHQALPVNPTAGRCGRKKPPIKRRPKLRC